MEMMLVVTIVLFVGIGLFYVVRWFVKERSKRAKERRIAKAYDRLLVRDRLVVYHVEFVGDRVVVLDKVNKKVAVIDHSGKAEREYSIALLDVSEIRLVEDKSRGGRIGRILLQLECRNGADVKSIEFFNQHADPIAELPALSRRAWHWKQRLEAHRRPGTVRSEDEFMYDSRLEVKGSQRAIKRQSNTG